MNRSAHPSALRRPVALGRWLLAAWCVGGGLAGAAEFSDTFAVRETVADAAGEITGSNLAATVEAGEPRHGGKRGGRSVWISWVAPADGVVTFRTAGSGFDTLLSAYTLDAGETTVDRLRETARNDDAVGVEPSSQIQFGARAGVRYEIAVDGFAGAAGAIRLRWDFADLSSPPPVILSVPDDQALRLGDPVTLSVDLEAGPDVDLQWRFNGQSFGAEGPTLVIPSLQATNVGRYTLRIRVGQGGDRLELDTTPVELQVNSDGQTNALARDKFFDSLGSPLLGENEIENDSARAVGRRGAVQSALRARSDGPVGVVRGYNGSQIFNTVYATVDPTEPAHCGVAGGASYWLAYQPPADGTLRIDTGGSTYDTVMEVFTHGGTPASYADLLPLACDHGGLSNGLASVVEVPVLKGRSYLVAVDGAGGARGIAWLNYRLDTNQPPQAPTLLSLPGRRVVAVGTDLELIAPVAASPPVTYTWRRGSDLLATATGPALRFTTVGREQSGDYSVTVSNYLGAPLTVLLPLRVVQPPRCEWSWVDGVPLVRFETLAGQSYFLQQAPAVSGPWDERAEPIVGTGEPALLLAPTGTNAFLRVRVE